MNCLPSGNTFHRLSKTKLGCWPVFPLGVPDNVRSCHTCLQEIPRRSLPTILSLAGAFAFPHFSTHLFPLRQICWVSLKSSTTAATLTTGRVTTGARTDTEVLYHAPSADRESRALRGKQLFVWASKRRGVSMARFIPSSPTIPRSSPGGQHNRQEGTFQSSGQVIATLAFTQTIKLAACPPFSPTPAAQDLYLHPRPPTAVQHNTISPSLPKGHHPVCRPFSPHASTRRGCLAAPVQPQTISSRKPTLLSVPILSFPEGPCRAVWPSADRWPSHGHKSLLTFPPPFPSPHSFREDIEHSPGRFRGALRLTHWSKVFKRPGQVSPHGGGRPARGIPRVPFTQAGFLTGLLEGERGSGKYPPNGEGPLRPQTKPASPYGFQSFTRGNSLTGRSGQKDTRS